MFVFNTVVIATHRRSGAQWAIDALRKNSPEISDTYMTLEQIEGGRDAVVPLSDFRRQLLNLDGNNIGQRAQFARCRSLERAG